jgi:hypothetical protein
MKKNKGGLKEGWTERIRKDGQKEKGNEKRKEG